MSKFMAILAVFVSGALAIGGPSGAKSGYPAQGEIGNVHINPYGLSPLSAVIKNGGYELSSASVRVLPKNGGQEIKYSVDDMMLKTYGGIPIFGLYADYQNSVEVSYTKSGSADKPKKITELYKIVTAPISLRAGGVPFQTGIPFESVEVKKVDKEFSDRLYLINNVPGDYSSESAQFVWNNPAGGALEWNGASMEFIVDTKGEIRWYFDSDRIMDYANIYKTGNQMGFRQSDDGALIWGYGQRYVKYDLMGREVFNRRLPLDYIDFSHSINSAQNGNYFMRVASANTKRADGKNVRTVRDVIVEVDQDGFVVDDWRLYDILDPYRSDVILTLDQGAVCLNIDASQSGHTTSLKELAQLDISDKFGDIAGTGIGRNWAHVNSVDYDMNDDSIVISSRHQSAIIKIGRDKKIRWIAGAHKGWKEKFKDKLLTPVDSKGNKIKCEDEMSKCPGYLNDEGGFDWTWTQHTAFIIDSKTNKNTLYLAAFDNGDARGLEQPAFANMKYSRAVIYKIDQKKMTIEQIWEYGKERGNEWFSAVTSLAEYHKDKDSVVVYSGTAGMQFDLAAGKPIGVPTPELLEFKWGAIEPSVQMRFSGTGIGYQAMPIDLNKAFNRQKPAKK